MSGTGSSAIAKSATGLLYASALIVDRKSSLGRNWSRFRRRSGCATAVSSGQTNSGSENRNDMVSKTRETIRLQRRRAAGGVAFAEVGDGEE